MEPGKIESFHRTLLLLADSAEKEEVDNRSLMVVLLLCGGILLEILKCVKPGLPK